MKCWECYPAQDGIWGISPPHQIDDMQVNALNEEKEEQKQWAVACFSYFCFPGKIRHLQLASGEHGSTRMEGQETTSHEKPLSIQPGKGGKTILWAGLLNRYYHWLVSCFLETWSLCEPFPRQPHHPAYSPNYAILSSWCLICPNNCICWGTVCVCWQNHLFKSQFKSPISQKNQDTDDDFIRNNSHLVFKTEIW